MRRLMFIFVLGIHTLPGNAQAIWMEVNSGISTPLNDIDFVTASVGYAVGKNGTIIKTIDGGFTWEIQNSTVSVELFDCEFFDEQIGWACGKQGVVLRTTNGGQNWTSHVILTNDDFHAVDFFGATNGYVAGKNIITGQAEIYYTTNGAISFTGISPPSSISDITDIVFFDLFSGYVLISNQLFYTTNQGFSWTPVILPTTHAMNRIEMSDFTHGWIVGQNGTILSTVTGTSWNAQTSGSVLHLAGLCLLDTNHLFACGNSGTLLSTTDGGATWVTNPVPLSTSFNAVDAIDSQTAWSCGNSGKMIRTHVDTDLEIQDYAGDVSVCPNQLFDIIAGVKNGGLAPVTSGNFKALIDGTPVIDFDWTGNIPAGSVDLIYMGQTSVTQGATLTISFTGDDLADNNSMDFDISMNAIEPYSVNGPFIVCPGETVELTATGGKDYHWLNATSDSSAQNQFVHPTTNSNYVVEIIQLNCTISDTVQVTVAGNCNTNAFSPNDDGTNDFFFIDNLPEGENMVVIFNRWGDEIVVLENYNNKDVFWSGNDASGASMTEGVYFYTVESKNIGPHAKGWVKLVR